MSFPPGGRILLAVKMNEILAFFARHEGQCFYAVDIATMNGDPEEETLLTLDKLVELEFLKRKPAGGTLWTYGITPRGREYSVTRSLV